MPVTVIFIQNIYTHKHMYQRLEQLLKIGVHCIRKINILQTNLVIHKRSLHRVNGEHTLVWHVVFACISIHFGHSTKISQNFAHFARESVWIHSKQHTYSYSFSCLWQSFVMVFHRLATTEHDIVLSISMCTYGR